MTATYLEALLEVGQRLSLARKPNPHRVVDGVAYVDVLYKSGELRNTFLVDEADLPLVLKHRWSLSASKLPRVVTSTHSSRGHSSAQLHRVLMNPPIGKLVAHLNGNPLDNRRENLHILSSKERSQRMGTLNSKGASKYRGVCASGRPGKPWRASITYNYTKHHSPNFLIEEEARDWAIAKRDELYTDKEEPMSTVAAKPINLTPTRQALLLAIHDGIDSQAALRDEYQSMAYSTVQGAVLLMVKHGLLESIALADENGVRPRHGGFSKYKVTTKGLARIATLPGAKDGS